MNLKAFVQETLVEIRVAIADAQKKLEAAGLVEDAHMSADSDTMHREVEFDVAVEASTEDGTQGGGGIKVLAGIVSVNGKGEKEVKEKESRVSRVKFKIPIYLPPAVGVKRR